MRPSQTNHLAIVSHAFPASRRQQAHRWLPPLPQGKQRFKIENNCLKQEKPFPVAHIY